jgi:protocatechuate 3,4-dioxygenase, beta subunit
MEGILGNHVRVPTDDQILGPFYPVMKPIARVADLTSVNGKNGKAQGQVIYLMGQVFNLNGRLIPDVEVEIWQANSFGRYTHPSDSNTAPIDPNFEGYGIQKTDAEGRYRFKTIKPKGYPVPIGWTRPPHIHFCVTSKTNRLITQLYFEGEPLNEEDLFFKNAINKGSITTKLVPPIEEMESDSLMAVWDITLGQL